MCSSILLTLRNTIKNNDSSKYNSPSQFKIENIIFSEFQKLDCKITLLISLRIENWVANIGHTVLDVRLFRILHRLRDTFLVRKNIGPNFSGLYWRSDGKYVSMDFQKSISFLLNQFLGTEMYLLTELVNIFRSLNWWNNSVKWKLTRRKKLFENW